MVTVEICHNEQSVCLDAMRVVAVPSVPATLAQSLGQLYGSARRYRLVDQHGDPHPVLDDLYDRPTDREAQREAAGRVMEAIAALGEKDRAFMKTWSPAAR